MASVTYGKYNYGKNIYGKNIMANETEPKYISSYKKNTICATIRKW